MKLRTKMFATLTGLVLINWAASGLFSQVADFPPKALDPNLKIELMVSEPDIVTPGGIAVDRDGRVFVIENHTHRRPEGYRGPKYDLIKVFQDKNGDGKFDFSAVFFEGTQNTMNLAVHPDGSLYVATRSEVFRLRDYNKDGRAEENTVIATLETTGKYPHNGLSGFAFDFMGNVYFGLGENLGHKYKLVAGKRAFKKTIEGTEGGCIFRTAPDGQELTKVATGFWNPFNICFDDFGRLYAVDNDPDWRPPCRLIHVVQGGDYGYRYSLGRRGTHPFTSWFGDIPGMLGMVAGTGEAPGGVISYQSGGMPQKYLGEILTTSWGIHALESYRLVRNGSTFQANAETFVKGGIDFRPVGIATGPDGSIYVSDWVKRSYPVHGFGRIWRVSSKSATPKPKKKKTDQIAFLSDDRFESQHAARNLEKTDEGIKFLKAQSKYGNQARHRATALKALIRSKKITKAESDHALLQDSSADVRAFAAHAVPMNLIDIDQVFEKVISQEVHANLIRRSKGEIPIEKLFEFLASDDRFTRQAARQAIVSSNSPEELAKLKLPSDTMQRIGMALIWHSFGDQAVFQTRIPELLSDTNPDVRFIALRWIGEFKLKQYLEQLKSEIKTKPLTGRLFNSYLATFDLIEQNRDGAEYEKQEVNIIQSILASEDASDETKILGLKKLQSAFKRDLIELKNRENQIKRLKEMIQSSPGVATESIHALADLGGADAESVIMSAAADPSQPEQVRAVALSRLNVESPKAQDWVTELAENTKSELLRYAAMNKMVGLKLKESSIEPFVKMAASSPEMKTYLMRIIDPNWENSAASRTGISGSQMVSWLRENTQRGDPKRGELIFSSQNLSKCSNCHHVDGRGGQVGPDLSHIGSQSAERILESILQPSNEVSPRYGKLFTEDNNIENRKALSQSIMPEGLLNRLTDQEIRDLVAYLKTLK